MSILSPFPVWKLASTDDASTKVSSPLATCALKRHPSVASSVNPTAPSTQALSRQKPFNLRDGVQESIKAITEQVEAKKIVISEVLYKFYNSEISLHFLHALSAYFIRVAKDCVVASRAQQPASRNRRAGMPLPPALPPDAEQGNGNGAGSTSDNKAALERAALLREVGQSYARVVVYCSNFERTAADALFFESLLHLARMVVAAAVSEPSLEPELDKEFHRIFRGTVFHRASIRLPPQPVSTSCHRCHARGDNSGHHGDEKWSAPGKSRAVIPRSVVSHSSPTKRSFPDPANERCKGSITGSVSGESNGGKTNRGISVTSSAGSASKMAACSGVLYVERVRMKMKTSSAAASGDPPNLLRRKCVPSSRGTGAKREPANRGRTPYAPSTISKRVDGPRTVTPGNGGEGGDGGGGMGINEDVESGRWPRRPGRPGHFGGNNPFAKSSISPSGSAGLKDGHHPFPTFRGEEIKGGQILDCNTMPKGGDAESGGDGIRAPEALPLFEELSRWRISRGTVSKMARLATAAQSAALSNVALAKSYRKSLLAKFYRAKATPIQAPEAVFAGVADGHDVVQSKPQERFGRGTGAVSKPISEGSPRRWTKSKRGRTLACGRGSWGHACSDAAGCHIYNAETLSVCIASVIEETDESMANPRFHG